VLRVLKERDGKVVRLVLDRPEALNALNQNMLTLLGQELHTLSRASNVRVIVFQGAGDKAFLAGADIAEMKTLSPIDAEKFSKTGQLVLGMIERLPQITIAMVQGFALGGGCELAMACDLIYASDKAKFGQPEVNLGVIAGFGGTQRLARLVGPMKARELLFTGKMIDGQEAKRVGLVCDVFPAEQLPAEVEKVIQGLLEKGPMALQRTKAVLYQGADMDLNKALILEQQHFALCFSGSEQREGMSAFLEKRKPQFG